MASDYDIAKRVAAEGDDAKRLALAAREDLAPELLFFLASDAAPGVRAAVARNATTPAKADRLLAADQDPAIRAMVGRKLAPRAPELVAGGDRVRQLAWETLCSLAADTAVLVRAVIAEEVASLADAPRDLILRLARDAAMEVAAPVIRFSPLLSEADLLGLVATPPAPETVSAVARRPGLTEALSDAIIACASEAATTTLLENMTAQIREQALDALIAEAAGRVGWQERLVRRPSLPPGAAQALAVIVAEHLLEPLATRSDLDPALAESLKARVAGRLAIEPAKPPATEAAEAAFETAARKGDRATMAQLLATAAAVPLGAVERAARLRSPKAIISLCWQAKFHQSTLTLAQTVLGQIGPRAALIAPAEGGWPLSPDEMLWQIELLQEPEAAG